MTRAPLFGQVAYALAAIAFVALAASGTTGGSCSESVSGGATG